MRMRSPRTRYTLGFVRPRVSRWSTTTWLASAIVPAPMSSSSRRLHTQSSSTLSAAALNPAPHESAQVERLGDAGGDDGERVDGDPGGQRDAEADRLAQDG